MASRIQNITNLAVLSLPNFAYNPIGLEQAMKRGALTESDIRKEYSRLRSITEKRLKRAEKKGLNLYDTMGNKIQHMPKLKGLTMKEIAYGLAQGRMNLQSQRGTSGLVTSKFKGDINRLMSKHDKAVQEGLRKIGHDMGINEINLFYDIMERMRAAGLGNLYYEYFISIAEKGQGDGTLMIGSNTKTKNNNLLRAIEETGEDYDLPSHIVQALKEVLL